MLQKLLQGINFFLASKKDKHIARLLLSMNLQYSVQSSIQVAVLRQGSIQQLNRVLPPLHIAAYPVTICSLLAT